MDRNYGISGYQPTRRPAPEPIPEGEEVPEVRRRLRPKDLFDRAKKKTSGARTQGLKWPLWKKILLGLGALFALFVFVIWFFLGEFRFMLWRAPSFTGFPFGTRTYLVLVQDNNELRPTGGAITDYAELTFSHGFYTGLTFHDAQGEIDDHQNVEAPLPMSTLLGASDEGQTFSTANYDPDFRLSKDELIKFYQFTHPDAEIDGVLAVDQHFLEEWVGMVGSVTVDEASLTPATLFESLESNPELTAPLVQKLITKTWILPWRLLTFRDLLAEAFREKHALAAFSRSGLASSFRFRNWDGALPQSDMGDFLAVNEGNYGGMKSDRYLTRDVQYELEVTDQKDVIGNPIVKATVQITLSHEGGNNPPLSGTYTGFLRTLIPLGAKVEVGSDITEQRDDSEVLGELVTLQPGESKTFTYTYELPEYVWNDGVYYLHLNKQAGTDQDHYRVIVKAPDGMGLSAPTFDVREGVAFLDVNLLADVNLSFSLLPDSKPPHLVSSQITAQNQITLVFNEALDSLYAQDPSNYSVVDMDHNDGGPTDEITVLSAVLQSNTVLLTTNGMTSQMEEHYEVVLTSLSDTHGNMQNPDPSSTTVVQKNLPVEPEETEETPSVELTNP